MNEISTQETDRQYRLTKQTLAMHYSIRDACRRNMFVTELFILAASVVFLVTTFADDDFYTLINLQKDTAKLILGCASVVVFYCSLVLLLVGWPDKTAKHGEAINRWASVLVLFRNSRTKNGEWMKEETEKLSLAYSDAAQNTVDIPDKKFNQLENRYLIKKEISRMMSENPGAPRFILWIKLRLTAIYSVFSRR